MYQCPYCTEKFELLITLSMHVETDHPGQSDKKDDKDKDKK
jgi:hypothetical protein